MITRYLITLFGVLGYLTLADTACQLETIGAATNTRARFNSGEWPYHRPPDMRMYDTENPFNVSDLVRGKRYLWVIDSDGKLRVARDYRPGHLADLNA